MHLHVQSEYMFAGEFEIKKKTFCVLSIISFSQSPIDLWMAFAGMSALPCKKHTIVSSIVAEKYEHLRFCKL